MGQPLSLRRLFPKEQRLIWSNSMKFFHPDAAEKKLGNIPHIYTSTPTAATITHCPTIPWIPA